MQNDSNTPEQSSASNYDSPPAFRINGKVVQFLMIILLALGLPITVAILGIIEMRKDRRPVVEVVDEPSSAEPIGLRSVLEHAAENAWKAPEVLNAAGARTFKRMCPSGEACLELGDQIKAVAISLDGVAIAPERIEEGGARWLIQIPHKSAQAFESELARLGFLGNDTSASSSVDTNCLYVIEIRIAQER
jgi:hypothetical protein